jgi:hypothetical protein
VDARLPGTGADVGYRYLEVLDCDTNQTVALDIVRRPDAHHEFERYMRCTALRASPRARKGLFKIRGYAYKRSTRSRYGLTRYRLTSRSPICGLEHGEVVAREFASTGLYHSCSLR